MFAIVKTDSRKNVNENGAVIGVTKVYKTYKAALKYAFNQNELFINKTLNFTFYVYDENKRELYKPQAVQV